MLVKELSVVATAEAGAVMVTEPEAKALPEEKMPLPEATSTTAITDAMSVSNGKLRDLLITHQIYELETRNALPRSEKHQN
jgi:hypothetical protein